MGDLVDLMHRAEQRARGEGYFSKGTSRVLFTQTLVMCKRDHPRWRLAGDATAPAKCGICHPPVPALEIAWL